MELSPKSQRDFVCAELVEFVAEKMAYGFQKAALRRVLEAQLEMHISTSVYEKLRKRARQLLIDQAANPITHGQNAIQIIYGIIQDPDTTAITRLKAAERLLDVSQQSTGTTSPEDRAAQLKEILNKIDESTSITDDDDSME